MKFQMNNVLEKKTLNTCWKNCQKNKRKFNGNQLQKKIILKKGIAYAVQNEIFKGIAV